jgi:hypothetical protein
MELNACTIDFWDHDVVHVHFKEGRMVDAPDVQDLFQAIANERPGRKVLLMVSVGDGTKLTNEARAFASSEASCAYIAADAIIVRDFEHQLAANVFVRHHRPHRPIRMFGDRESALAWLHEQHHLIDTPGSNA